MIELGQWLGVLGGGQLGRMFCAAAQSLGYRVCVLDPDPDSPAGAVADRHIRGDYADPEALAQLARVCKAVTTEFENVPAESLQQLARQCEISPPAKAVTVAQDRRKEKAFAQDCGLEVAPHAVIDSEADLARTAASLLPGVLKVARLGYDGKGQIRVAGADDLATAWRSLGAVPSVLEQWLPLEREISVIVCRDRQGRTVTFPVCENQHRGGILAATIAPARIEPALEQQARAAATRLAEQLDYVGVLCVEFFVLRDGRLLVNELAPRPHNSGHHTIDACTTSQFEQQARILARLPLGDTQQWVCAVMLNLLGDLWFDGGRLRAPRLDAVAAVPGARLHIYGKTEARPGRKMGHVTLLGASVAQALERAAQVAQVLGLEPPQ